VTTVAASLRERFLSRCLEDLQVVRRALEEPAFRKDSYFIHIVHRMAGAGGLFGYPRLTTLAQALDDALVNGYSHEISDIQGLSDELLNMAEGRILPLED